MAEHVVGRIEELASREQVRGELDRGRVDAIELGGESGIDTTRRFRDLARTDAAILSSRGSGIRA